jgi:hypothetical protein
MEPPCVEILQVLKYFYHFCFVAALISFAAVDLYADETLNVLAVVPGLSFVSDIIYNKKPFDP